MKNLPVALQLYTVRDFITDEQTLKTTLKAVKDMGYDYVELASLYDYDMEPEYLRKIMDEIGLTVISAHVPLAELSSDPLGTIDKYVTMGCKYVAIPYLDDVLRPGQEGFTGVLENILKIGKTAASKNVTLLYHNHDFEFVKGEDGIYGFDKMYMSVPDEYLNTEIDTCWVKVAGEDPAEYIIKYTGRSPVVHLKDFVGSKSENMYELIGIDKKADKTQAFAFKPVGYGVQNIPNILDASVKAGALYVVVEQDRSDDCSSIDAAKKSRDYLRSLGW